MPYIGLFEVDLGLDDISPALEPVELNDSASNVMSNGDISMSIPQPNDDDSIPQPDVDDSIPQPDVDDDSMFDDNKDQVLENQRCDEFLLKTCSWSKVNRKPCSSLCTVQHYTDLRAQASYVNSLIW